ncbi:hypothetical protein A9Q74_16920 [Colwellia sp. 39_35_sub15_T18]|nr:hypothetical protein A9Q74_16920 [Colwellia sp. 39_35_sub15_T18]
MTINDEILALANQLANNGKKPTVALIKGKLTKTVPLPTIISTLKTWQHDPSFVAQPQKNEQINIEASGNSSETDPLRQILNEELAQMRHDIVELKLLIQQLLAQQK